MKKIVYLTTSIVLIFFGCEKQEKTNQIRGTWKVIGISGGFVGFESIRDFDKVSFDNSDNYLVYFNGTVIQGGSYKIEKQAPEKYGNIIVEYLLTLKESFDNDSNANFYAEIPFDVIYESDSLTLSQINVGDGYSYHFVRDEI